jgi:hypothetical protein
MFPLCPRKMAINVYLAVFEPINTKKNYDILFLFQRCYASLVYYSDKNLYTGPRS